MKKILGWLFAIIAMLQTPVLAAPAQDTAPVVTANVLETRGSLADVNSERIQVIGQGAYDEIILNITEQTYIVNGQDGMSATLEPADQGQAVTVYYGPRLTRSIPPQGNAVAVVKGKPEGSGMYMEIAEVQPAEDGVRVLCTNRDRLVTISEKVLPNAKRLQAGDELLVWYQAMTLSLPGQATATKAVLLTHDPVLEVDVAKKTVGIQGRSFVLAKGESVKDDRGTVWLPLRSVVEKLGYKIEWRQESQSATLVKGAATADLTLNSYDYGRQKMRVRLKDSPQLVDSKMYVPLEFFSEVLGMSVQMNGK